MLKDLILHLPFTALCFAVNVHAVHRANYWRSLLFKEHIKYKKTNRQFNTQCWIVIVVFKVAR